MRRARVTFQGAYHHVINRGYEGKPILKGKNDKKKFLNLLKLYSEKLNIRIFSYCLMDNHYHFILENSSGRMSDFLKQLNGNFGSLYRAKYGGKGYVFQDRFRSMLIQDESYLLLSIAYVLNNPVRAGLVSHFLDYRWSSASQYFNKNKTINIVAKSYVEDLFQDQKNLINMVSNSNLESLPVIETRVGKIIGEGGYVEKAVKKFDRRKDKESMEGKRIDDLHFEPVGKIYMEFEQKYKIKVDSIDTTVHSGKKLRGEILVNLRDRGGLKYSEIIKLDLFSDMKHHSLGQLYKRAKIRMQIK
jgi:REP element-mobilizing transposase RayT